MTDFTAWSKGCWILIKPKTVSDLKKKKYKDLFVFLFHMQACECKYVRMHICASVCEQVVCGMVQAYASLIVK